MRRIFAVFAIGVMAFTVVVAFAAALAPALTGPTLSAASMTISRCGNATSVAVAYEYVNPGTGFKVDKVLLTAYTGTSFTGGAISCQGGMATMNFGATQVLRRSITSGDLSGSGNVLTLDVTDIAVTEASNFSILIEN